MATPLRVAVAGASGIGKHHAKWHHQAGADVVAFLGSTAASCAATRQALDRIFPFTGRDYTDFDRLLETEQPDVVDVCTPAELHFDVARRALEAGCHVLCEKPLIWQEGVPLDQLLERGRQLVALARRRDRRFAVCTQYAASGPQYCRLYEASRGEAPAATRFEAEMETLARVRRREAEAVWMDMGPHPLSLLLSWLPDGHLVPDTLAVEFGSFEARAAFDFAAGPTRCRCELQVRDLESGPLRRRFGVDGYLVDCEGRPDRDGVYRCVLRHDASESVGDDYMSLLIAQFDAAARDPEQRLMVPGELGLRNLELQLEILSRARASR
jgi:predicted dehydrogenase